MEQQPKASPTITLQVLTPQGEAVPVTRIDASFRLDVVKTVYDDVANTLEITAYATVRPVAVARSAEDVLHLASEPYAGPGFIWDVGRSHADPTGTGEQVTEKGGRNA